MPVLVLLESLILLGSRDLQKIKRTIKVHSYR